MAWMTRDDKQKEQTAMGKRWGTILGSVLILVVGSIAVACGGGKETATSAASASVTTVSASSTSAPVATSTTAEPTLSTGLELSNSADVGEGDVLFEAGSTAGSLKVTINGTVPVTDQSAIAWFSMKTIRIAAGLTVPLDLLGAFEFDTAAKVVSGSMNQNLKVVNHQPTNDIESIEWDACVLDYPIPANSANAIVAGANGATLKKDAKTLLLVEGDALQQK